MRLTITIDMEKSPFEPACDECARILRIVANRIEGRAIVEGFSHVLRDIKGNTVGKAEVAE